MTDTRNTGALYATAGTQSASLETSALAWTDTVANLRSGTLTRSLIAKGIHPDVADARVRILARSIGEAAAAVAEAARCLHAVTVDVDVMHEEARATNLRITGG